MHPHSESPSAHRLLLLQKCGLANSNVHGNVSMLQHRVVGKGVDGGANPGKKTPTPRRTNYYMYIQDPIHAAQSIAICKMLRSSPPANVVPVDTLRCAVLCPPPPDSPSTHVLPAYRPPLATHLWKVQNFHIEVHQVRVHQCEQKFSRRSARKAKGERHTEIWRGGETTRWWGTAYSLVPKGNWFFLKTTFGQH